MIKKEKNGKRVFRDILNVCLLAVGIQFHLSFDFNFFVCFLFYVYQV